MCSVELAEAKKSLPDIPKELRKFILASSARIENFRRVLRAIDKIGDIHGKREEILEEAQQWAILMLEAEIRLGEILKVANLRGGDRRSEKFQTDISVGLKEFNLSEKESERAQQLAKHRDLVDEEIDIAIEVGDVPSKYGALKRIKKFEHEQKKKEVNLIIPKGLFEIIVIDPPWPYDTRYDPDGRRGAAPYNTMSIERIKNMEIPATDNCIVWLWTTHKFMHEAFHVLDSWNFEPKMILTWVKNRMGIGIWLRSITEFCIMATKGSPEVNLTNQTTILYAPIREHSRKPDEFYLMIDTLCPGRKLDMFSREKREGWEQMGNQTDIFHK